MGGNTMVVIIFGVMKKRTKTSYSVFMVTMGVVDVLSCSLIMPWSLITTFVLPVQGYISRYIFHVLASWSVYSTMSMCVLVAIDRYLSICWPLSHVFTFKRAKMICLAASVSSLVLAILAVVPPHSWIGSEYGATTMYAGTVLTVICLYSMVWKTIRKISKSRVAPMSHGVVTLHPNTSYSISSSNTRSIQIATHSRGNLPTMQGHAGSCGTSTNDNQSSRTVPTFNAAVKSSGARTAIMFCMVTVVFCISWLPSWLFSLDVPVAQFRGAIFMNNVMNPFIYYALNKRFATEIVNFMKCRFQQ